MNHFVKFFTPFIVLMSINNFTNAATSDGKNLSASIGWMHIMPQGKEQNISGDALGNPTFSPNAGFKIDDGDAFAILLDYYVNDNVSLEFVGGYPPKMEILGKGKALDDMVDLGKLGVVGDVDAYTPALLAKYQFGDKDSIFRPFVGGGIMYAHFSDFTLKNGVNESLTNQLNLGGLEIQNVKIEDAVAPIVTIGADYNFNKSWFATASVSYAHLKTKASLDIKGTSGIASWFDQPVVKGNSTIEINPIVTYLGIGYKF
ncbi:OmpW/AlkL family protein [Acinetobacter baumannii]|uniref:OmpW/AlkL family protein n=1 Tax=Acinetobacter baumannii TaxID=470 RepID=UPI003B430FF9